MTTPKHARVFRATVEDGRPAMVGSRKPSGFETEA
jgi:hypothetical protein